jgi:hypothetical protein
MGVSSCGHSQLPTRSPSSGVANLTRSQAKSAQTNAKAAAEASRRAEKPKLELSLDNDTSELLVISDGPDEYTDVELVSLGPVDQNYFCPIQILMVGDSPASWNKLGRIAPRQQKSLKFQKLTPTAGGGVHVTFRCETRDGREHICYSSVEVPGEPLPARSLTASLSSEHSANGAKGVDAAAQAVRLVQSLNWAVQRLCACCFKAEVRHRLEGGTEACTAMAQELTKEASYRTLVQAVTDLISDLVPGKRRLAVYYGNGSVLVPWHLQGWDRSDPPLLSVAGSSNGNAPPIRALLNHLSDGNRLYVPDTEKALGEERRFAQLLPDWGEFRSFTLVPIRAFPSIVTDEQEGSFLMGAILVQHADPAALALERDREALSLLASMLGVAIAHVATHKN